MVGVAGLWVTGLWVAGLWVAVVGGCPRVALFMKTPLIIHDIPILLKLYGDVAQEYVVEYVTLHACSHNRWNISGISC